MKYLSTIGTIIVLTAILAVGVSAQTTEFTYQGSLKDGANAANGNYDFEFRVYTATGAQIGSLNARSAVSVTAGIFSVSLDFGNQFPGADRFLEISVRNAGGGAFTTLTPRQKIDSSPYAIKSLTAETANSATNAATANSLSGSCIGCVTAAQIGSVNGSAVSGTIPVASVPAGSGNYIQNQNTAPQASSNFNVSGTGTANIISATTQYNIGGGRVLSVAGTNNIYVGFGAGGANSIGDRNSFFGTDAGFSNTTGDRNSFFGTDAGKANTSGFSNSFFGSFAGIANTTGISNSIFGGDAGRANTVGFNNAFFGRAAGQANTSGISNSFFGTFAGQANTTGDENSFFGTGAGTLNTTGTNNTMLGRNAQVGSGNLTFATAIGADSVATESNSVWLGRSADIVYVPGFLRLSQLGGAGATAVCRNNANTLGTCSSSLRYKTNIGQFGLGLSLINQLKPITFDWKDGGMHDLGLGAEDVAAIEPLLVTYNEKGQVEGVKYDRIGVVLVNAVKEQQAEISDQQSVIAELNSKLKDQSSEIGKQQKRLEQQRDAIEQQQAQIDALKKLVCSLRSKAALCRKTE